MYVDKVMLHNSDLAWEHRWRISFGEMKSPQWSVWKGHSV